MTPHEEHKHKLRADFLDKMRSLGLSEEEGLELANLAEMTVSTVLEAWEMRRKL